MAESSREAPLACERYNEVIPAEANSLITALLSIALLFV
jgi:hypothetical protein